MMYMLRNCVSDSVYQIIESDIHKDWNLSMVASCLCLSPSLLKKKLKSENTSYSQIITTCRMRYAVNELMMDGKKYLSGITVLRLQQYVVLYFCL